MTVTLHASGSAPRPLGVYTVAAAARIATEWQDAEGLGASDLGACHGEIHDDFGQLIARVAYNGRVLPP